MAYKHKRGNTFGFTSEVDIKDDGVTVTNLLGWTGRCQIRTQDGTLVAEPRVVWIDPQARLCRVYVPNYEGTASWPVTKRTEPLQIEVEFTSPGGDVVSTTVEQIEVYEGVVRAA